MGRTHDKELIGAAEKGHNPRVERLLGQGADVNALRDGTTALVKAVGQGHLDVVRTLLNAGADPDLQTDWGRSPLDAACSLGNLVLVKLLLARGADVNSMRNCWPTPLYWAISKGHDLIAQTLIDAGAVTDRGGHYGNESMYRVALRERRERVAQYLRSKGLHR